MRYMGRNTLFEYIRREIPDGLHTFVLRGGEHINVEVLNLGDTEYLESPELGLEPNSMLVLKYDNLTIGTSVTLTPTEPRRGMCIYVKGKLTNNGTISMTARGIEAVGQDIYLYDNEFIPACGASGGESSGKTGSSAVGTGHSGKNGVNRQTGGGASGSWQLSASSGAAWSGVGGYGTSYSGGSGGGAAIKEETATSAYGGDGSSYGGEGGYGVYNVGASASQPAATGGAGNPGGAGSNPRGRPVTQLDGSNGTGGLLIIFANTIQKLGSVESKGSNGGIAHNIYGDGGSSGGGSINIFFTEMQTYDPELLSATGGESRTTNYGGDGTVSLNQITTLGQDYVTGDNLADVLQFLYEKGGTPGVQGNPGVLVPLPINTSLFAVGIDNNEHLIVSYADEANPPPLSIDSRGHLMWEIESPQEIDLGILTGRWTPDYAAIESINRITSNNGIWTVDRDGFILAQGEWYRTPGMKITINGVSVYETIGISSNPGGIVLYKNVYPVAIGDVIMISSPNSIGCYYIPPRLN